MASELITGECHCGQIKFALSAKPAKLVDCNCSICNRLGALWGHVETKYVSLSGSGVTTAYVHGEKSIAFHTCQNCGCNTHWENRNGGDDSPMAVNFRMCDRAILNDFTIRKFDGADSWTFLD